MRKADAQLKLARKLFEIKMKRLTNSAMPSPFGWMERDYKAQLAWSYDFIRHLAAEAATQELKSQGKDISRRFWSV